jgi:hypothetical protein
MQYTDIRPRIKSGDLLAWSHIGLGSWHDLKIWLVRLFMRSEYSHVGTAWVVGDRVFVIEAVMPLVRIFPLSLLGNFYHLSMDAPWKPKTEVLALSLVGHKYSQLQAMQSPFSKPPADNLWECAELAASIAKSDGIDLGQVYTPSAVILAAQTQGAPMVFVINPVNT